jgi:hypothetical protein
LLFLRCLGYRLLRRYVSKATIPSSNWLKTSEGRCLQCIRCAKELQCSIWYVADCPMRACWWGFCCGTKFLGPSFSAQILSFAQLCTVQDYGIDFSDHSFAGGEHPNGVAVRPEFSDKLSIKAGRHPIRENPQGSVRPQRRVCKPAV